MPPLQAPINPMLLPIELRVITKSSQTEQCHTYRKGFLEKQPTDRSAHTEHTQKARPSPHLDLLFLFRNYPTPSSAKTPRKSLFCRFGRCSRAFAWRRRFAQYLSASFNLGRGPAWTLASDWLKAFRGCKFLNGVLQAYHTSPRGTYPEG